MDWKFNKQASDGKPWASYFAFLFCFGILYIRAGARIQQGGFWAEDGNVFFNEALQFGWKSLFLPHASYFHVLQRTILLTLYTVFPLDILPNAIALVSIAVVAWVNSRWISEDYEWILPTRVYRGGFAFILCLAPGLGEMLGNLCNLNWFFTHWVALLLLRDSGKSFKIWEAFFAVLVFYSVGTGLLLLPLLWWRFSRQPKVLTGIGVFFAVYIILIINVRDPSRTEIPVVQWGEWIRTYIRQMRISVLLQPLLGDSVTTMFSLGKGVRKGNVVAFMALAALLPWCIKNRRERAIQGVLTFLLSFSAWMFLVWMGRTGSIKIFQQPLGPWFFENRYSFPISWGAFLLWFVFSESLFHRRKLYQVKNVALALFLGWSVYTSSYRFKVPAYRVGGEWPKTAHLLRTSMETGCPKTVGIKVFPGDAFDFQFKSVTTSVTPCP